MEKYQGKIVLPKRLQEEMLRFFIKTSIPRKKEKSNKSPNKK